MSNVSEFSSVCPTCGESDFSSRRSFVRHTKMHEPIDTKFCDVCGKIFESVINYNDHVRKVHVVKDILRLWNMSKIKISLTSPFLTAKNVFTTNKILNIQPNTCSY